MISSSEHSSLTSPEGLIMNKCIALLLPCLILFMPGCREKENTVSQKNAQEPVKIGILGPFSGPDQKIGQSTKEGIQAALKSSGKLNYGKDDGNDKEKTVAAFKELIAEHVSLILAASDSECILTLQESADQNNVPVLAILASHPGITKSKLISQLPFDDSQQAKVAALFAMDEMLLNTAAVIYDPGSAHYTTLADNFVEKYKSLGGKVHMYPLAVDMSMSDKMLTELNSNAIPFVYLALPPTRFVETAQEIKDTYLSPVLMGSDSLLATIRLQNARKLENLEGILATDYFSSNAEITSFGKQIIARFDSDFDSPQTVMAGLGAEALAVALHAMNRCADGKDSICVATMIRNTVDLEGINGKISIDKEGKSERVIFINRFENNEPKFLLKIY